MITGASLVRGGLALVLVLVTGCGTAECGPGASCAAPCKAYVTCYEATGGTKGSLDSTYGAMGSCWSTTQQAALDCERFCNIDVQRLIAMYPDAGCAAR